MAHICIHIAAHFHFSFSRNSHPPEARGSGCCIDAVYVADIGGVNANLYSAAKVTDDAIWVGLSGSRMCVCACVCVLHLRT